MHGRSMSSDEFVPEQHFCPKYSIDNCDSSALIEIGDGRRSHPRRDKSSWFETCTLHCQICSLLMGCLVLSCYRHIKWTAKYQATLKTPLNPEKYPCLL